MDQRIHRDDMVEPAERGIEHVADAPVDRQARRRAVARDVDQAAGDVDRDDLAPRRAASTASAPVPQPASSSRSPVMSAGSHDSSVSRIRLRPARTVARMPLTGASEVSRSHVFDAVRSK